MHRDASIPYSIETIPRFGSTLSIQRAVPTQHAPGWSGLLPACLRSGWLRAAVLCSSVLCAGLISLNVSAQPDSLPPAAASAPDQVLTQQLAALMENPRNPLLEISSSEGDIHLELFADAAPLSVRRVLDLVNGRLMPAPNGAGYYDGLTFHRVVAGHFLQTGAAERAGRQRPDAIADEINARGLGLEQQKLLDATGKPHAWLNLDGEQDFQTRVLTPLYRSLNIHNESQLSAQQNRVLQALRDMNLMQLHELIGYRYNGSLSSRRPLAGSVMLANHGPRSNDAELLLSLQDAPWLMATHTVIGRIVSGQTLANSISRQPEASVRIYHIRQLEISHVPTQPIQQ